MFFVSSHQIYSLRKSQTLKADGNDAFVVGRQQIHVDAVTSQQGWLLSTSVAGCDNVPLGSEWLGEDLLTSPQNSAPPPSLYRTALQSLLTFIISS